MATKYITIESVNEEVKGKVKENLKFKTNQFVWQIKFTTDLNPSTVNNSNLYVTSMTQIPLKTSIRYASIDKCIEIEPLEPYSKGQSYQLHISKNVKSRKGQKLSDDIVIQFKV